MWSASLKCERGRHSPHHRHHDSFWSTLYGFESQRHAADNSQAVEAGPEQNRGVDGEVNVSLARIFNESTPQC